jgi:signal peptidase I
VLGRIRRTALFELVFTLAIALGLALSVQALAVKPYRIPSGSMEPTLQIGDRVLVNRLFDHLGIGPKVGQIVVFHPPAGAGDDDRCGRSGEGPGEPRPCSKAVAAESGTAFVKRVVALGGDRLAIRDGHVYRNGVRERDAYAMPCGGGPACTFSQTIVVPRGTVFLMGDNRGDSDDSRYWGPVPQSWLIGSVLARYWPPKRVDAL